MQGMLDEKYPLMSLKLICGHNFGQFAEHDWRFINLDNNPMLKLVSNILQLSLIDFVFQSGRCRLQS